MICPIVCLTLCQECTLMMAICIYPIGLVQSHYDYCSVVWGNCGKTLRDKLQRLQNRAARVLTNSNYDADASILLNDLEWQNLETQRQFQKAVMVYNSSLPPPPPPFPVKYEAARRRNRTVFPSLIWVKGRGCGNRMYCWFSVSRHSK